MVKKAMFMPGHVPEGGACVSSFIVAEKEGSLILGKLG
jgi:hypothetical protein